MNLSNITVVPLDNIAVYNYMSSHEEDSLENIFCSYGGKAEQDFGGVSLQIKFIDYGI